MAATNKNRRSSSFNLLPLNSPGDGDGELLPPKPLAPSVHGHRKRRKNKNKKNLASQQLELELGISLSASPDLAVFKDVDGARSAVSTPGGFSGSDQHAPFGHVRFVDNSDGNPDGIFVCRSQSLPSSTFSHCGNDLSEVDSNGIHMPVPVCSSACSSQTVGDNGDSASAASPSMNNIANFAGTTASPSVINFVDDAGTSVPIMADVAGTTASPLLTDFADDAGTAAPLSTNNFADDASSAASPSADNFADDAGTIASQSVMTDNATNTAKSQNDIEDSHLQQNSRDMNSPDSMQSDHNPITSIATIQKQHIKSFSAELTSALSGTVNVLHEQRFNVNMIPSFVGSDGNTCNHTVEGSFLSKDKVTSSWSDQLSKSELRQRILPKDSSECSNNHVNEGFVDMSGNNQTSTVVPSNYNGANISYQTPQKLTRVPVLHAETPQLVGWQQLMSDNTMCPQQIIGSPFDYFVGEVLRTPSNSQETQSAETDKKRQHVYNTMFHVPWRCELLIIVGFFVCLDSFLSLLTVMPVRVIVFFRRLLANRRQLRRLRSDELGDLGSLLVLVAGVTLLQQTDISYIYHMIRSQATIKLYVVYNVLEIFDKLCQSFGSDVLQVLLNSAENVASCPSCNLLPETLRFALDQGIAMVSFIVHSYIILAQSITVSAAIRSHNNALLTLLISNNFAEIKSNVFKRLGKDNLHKMAYLDTVERFHIIAHLFFVLAQNLLAANEPWLIAFAWNAGMVFLCEILVDVIKHAFLAKFNEIKPAAYSEFLLSLCQQTLNSQSHEVHKTLSFVPYAPACVVIRVLIPLYAAYLPGEFMWRLLFTFLYGILTYLFLIALKILVSFGLMKHASWYVARYRKKEKLLHFD